MKIHDLMIAVSAVTLALSVAGCGKSEETSKAAGAAPASIAPVASVSIAAPASDATVASAEPAAADAAAAMNETAVAATSADASNANGEKVYKSVCFMCHQTGAAGAPILGDKGDWAPRIAAGKPTLYRHALEGFAGNNGAMPARGGNPSLKDADVEAAVDFMIAKAQ